MASAARQPAEVPEPRVELPPGLARMVELGLAVPPLRNPSPDLYEPLRPLGGSSSRELVDFVRGDR